MRPKIFHRAVVYPAYGWSTFLWLPAFASVALVVVADVLAEPDMLLASLGAAAFAIGIALHASVREDRDLGPGPIQHIARPPRRIVRLVARAAVALVTAMTTLVFRRQGSPSSKKKQGDGAAVHSA
ncbi:MAG: hypothetical protein KF773_40610 [Deltaproteobacteria bacterium]|nr:hypothetical protein [Deltaproteobacteria bacterium]MCW5808070.1 hypothetical protein [Deltaproteobacteria bacterium]